MRRRVLVKKTRGMITLLLSSLCCSAAVPNESRVAVQAVLSVDTAGPDSAEDIRPSASSKEEAENKNRRTFSVSDSVVVTRLENPDTLYRYHGQPPLFV